MKSVSFNVFDFLKQEQKNCKEKYHVQPFEHKYNIRTQNEREKTTVIAQLFKQSNFRTTFRENGGILATALATEAEKQKLVRGKDGGRLTIDPIRLQMTL